MQKESQEVHNIKVPNAEEWSEMLGVLNDTQKLHMLGAKSEINGDHTLQHLILEFPKKIIIFEIWMLMPNFLDSLVINLDVSFENIHWFLIYLW